MSEFQDATTEEFTTIFLKEEKGCEWYSLTDDLTSEVHSLGISDLHSVTAQLLSSQPLSSSDETSLTIDDPLHYSHLINGLDIIHETCESSSLDEGDGDIETETGTLTETALETNDTGREYSNFTYRYKKPLTSSLNLRRIKKPTAVSTSESNNSDSSIQSCTYVQGKRKGGWPKGRKRKPPDSLEIKAPKAPSTGYVLYLIEQRKHYSNKNMSFPEVTKKIGNDWSKLNECQKKYYLDKAEIDKKRYRDELRQYRKSEAYQRKRLKPTDRPIGTEESDFDATDEIEDEDNEALYCKACDQWFVTYHNKKEHMYGKQHLGKVSKWKQSVRMSVPAHRAKTTDNSSCYSFDESSLDAASLTSPRRDVIAPNVEVSEPPVLGVNDSIIGVMKTFQERESEINYLRHQLNLSQERKDQWNKLISNLKKRKKQLTKMTTTMKEEEKQLQKKLSKFWSVVSTFVTLKDDSGT